MRANYRLGDLPAVYRKRYPFPMSWHHMTSAPIGKLVPLRPIEVLPGTTWSINMNDFSSLTSTFYRPIMDDVDIDTFSWFVPLRLCYDKTENVFGDPRPSAYTKPVFSSLPTFPPLPDGTYYSVIQKGSVLDHMGIPTYGSVNMSQYTVTRPRAFAFCYDEFVRNQNTDNQMVVQKGEAVSTEVPNGNPWSPTNYTGMLPPVPRYNDYFSTCLLAPQKGPAVRIPGFIADMPVGTSIADNSPAGQPLRFRGFIGSEDSGGNFVANQARSLSFVPRSSGNSSIGQIEVKPYDGSSDSLSNSVEPINLKAFSSDVADATINNLRTAFQFQKYYERDAVYGSRYREYIYAAYAVETDDASLQIPQFLAHGHHRMNVTPVASTSDAVSGDSQSYPVGQYAGTSRTFNASTLKFTKSFTEHGYIVTAFCLRYRHLYSQGVSKGWKRKNRQDFYDPLFANLGMQAVMLDEIYAETPIGQGGPVPPDDPSLPQNIVFGYQDAWSEYRHMQSCVSGQMRPSPGSLGEVWSAADFYESQPSLLDVVHETSDPFDRLLSVDQETQDPFVIDFRFDCVCSQIVPYYSMPGYVDHH